MYTAVYLPNAELDKSGFSTEDEAIQYVVENHLCSMCIEEGEGWLSSCAAEWIVAETSKVEICEGLDDLLEVAGYERVE